MPQATNGKAWRWMRAAALVATAALVLPGCGADEPGGPTVGLPATSPVDAGESPGSVASASPTPLATAWPSGRPRSSATASVVPPQFATRAPGARLPTPSQCAAWVRARPRKENKGVNRGPNQTTGHRVDPAMFSGNDPRAGRLLAPRIDGRFTGTTEEILRWAACKWGIDEDIVKAQAAIESWWRQATLGDFGADGGACPPGHGLGVDGRPGVCPQSFGILQNRYPYLRSAFPGAANSTAMSADLAYGIWRSCFEGYETWLNTVQRGEQYRAGDVWGCVGRWFSGRWHTDASEQYVGRVRDYLRQRIWETADFQQP